MYQPITEQWFVCRTTTCKAIAYPGVRTDPTVHHAGFGVVKKYRMMEGGRAPCCIICGERMTPTEAPHAES